VLVQSAGWGGRLRAATQGATLHRILPDGTFL